MGTRSNRKPTLEYGDVEWFWDCIEEWSWYCSCWDRYFWTTIKDATMIPLYLQQYTWTFDPQRPYIQFCAIFHLSSFIFLIRAGTVFTIRCASKLLSHRLVEERQINWFTNQSTYPRLNKCQTDSMCSCIVLGFKSPGFCKLHDPARLANFQIIQINVETRYVTRMTASSPCSHPGFTVIQASLSRHTETRRLTVCQLQVSLSILRTWFCCLYVLCYNIRKFSTWLNRILWLVMILILPIEEWMD